MELALFQLDRALLGGSSWCGCWDVALGTELLEGLLGKPETFSSWRDLGLIPASTTAMCSP